MTDVHRIAAMVATLKASVDDLTRRIEVLESAESDRESADEAATHSDGCKCGYYGHC